MHIHTHTHTGTHSPLTNNLHTRPHTCHLNWPTTNHHHIQHKHTHTANRQFRPLSRFKCCKTDEWRGGRRENERKKERKKEKNTTDKNTTTLHITTIMRMRESCCGMCA